MPVYEFICKECGIRFDDYFPRIQEKYEANCPECGKLAERQEVHSFGFSFKGGTEAESIDMTVGRDAEKRWSQYHQRQEQKNKTKKESGFVARDPDGNYSPATETQVVNRAADRDYYKESYKKAESGDAKFGSHDDGIKVTEKKKTI